MSITAVCPNCGTVVTLEPVPLHCARCGQEVEPGRYVVATRGRYAGRPVCVRCIVEQAEINLLGEAAGRLVGASIQCTNGTQERGTRQHAAR